MFTIFSFFLGNPPANDNLLKAEKSEANKQIICFNSFIKQGWSLI